MPAGNAVRLDEVRADAARCTRCDLYREATRTVFGEGLAAAWLMLVGEQPGDREDVVGKPFVGPAGHLLDQELELVAPSVVARPGYSRPMHPSSVLRADDRDAAYAAFVGDLRPVLEARPG